MIEKILYLIRGCSGAGKNHFAESLGYDVVSTDEFWMNDDGEYCFDADRLCEAHKWCFDIVKQKMECVEPRIMVANTFTQEKWMQEYFDLAKRNGYLVHSIIVENRHGGVNVHDVPEDVVQEQRDKFEIKL